MISLIHWSTMNDQRARPLPRKAHQSVRAMASLRRRLSLRVRVVMIAVYVAYYSFSRREL